MLRQWADMESTLMLFFTCECSNYTFYEYYCVAACTNQQAPLCQRHSPVQTGSEGLLQAGQRSATNHSLRIQGLPAGGVKGTVHFRAKSQTRGAAKASSDRTSVCFSFQKHENEFNEAAALRELYKYIQRYFQEVSSLHLHTTSTRRLFAPFHV